MDDDDLTTYSRKTIRKYILIIFFILQFGDIIMK